MEKKNTRSRTETDRFRFVLGLAPQIFAQLNPGTVGTSGGSCAIYTADMHKDKRRYRKLYVRIWREPRFRALSDGYKAATLYLLTGPQTNRVGCYVLSPALAAEDLNITLPAFLKRLSVACETFGWQWDTAARVFFMRSWWVWNEPESATVLAGAMRDLEEVPPSLLTQECLSAMHERGGIYAEAAENLEARAKILSHQTVRPSTQTLRQVKERDGDTCRYCGCIVDWNDRRSAKGGTFDHVLPGGSNDVSNLAVSCRGCNSKKGPRTPEQAGMTAQNGSSPVQNGSNPDLSADLDITASQEQEQKQEQKQEQEQEPPAPPPAARQPSLVARQNTRIVNPGGVVQCWDWMFADLMVMAAAVWPDEHTRRVNLLSWLGDVDDEVRRTGLPKQDGKTFWPSRFRATYGRESSSPVAGTAKTAGNVGVVQRFIERGRTP